MQKYANSSKNSCTDIRLNLAVQHTSYCVCLQRVTSRIVWRLYASVELGLLWQDMHEWHSCVYSCTWTPAVTVRLGHRLWSKISRSSSRNMNRQRVVSVVKHSWRRLSRLLSAMDRLPVVSNKDPSVMWSSFNWNLCSDPRKSWNLKFKFSRPMTFRAWKTWILNHGVTELGLRPGKSWRINPLVAAFLTHVHVFSLYIRYHCPLSDSVRSVV